jgi:hypothetical protein
MPTPRQTTPKKTPTDTGSGRTFSIEVIEGSRGKFYTIRGGLQVLGADIQGRVGEKVWVEWFNGRAIRIVNYDIRRGAVHTVVTPANKGIVEELLLARNPKTNQMDVWFRNNVQLTPLNIVGVGGVEPDLVFWGMNDDVFGVREQGSETKFHIFTLDRTHNHVLGHKPAKIKAKLYFVDFAETDSVVTLVTFKWHRDCGRPVMQSTFTLSDHLRIPEDPFTNRGTIAATGPTLGRNSDTMNLERTIGVTLHGTTALYTESHVGVRLGSVSATINGVLIDERNELLISVSVSLNEFGAKASPTGGGYPGLTGAVLSHGRGIKTPGPPGNGFIPFCPLTDVVSDPDPTYPIHPVRITEIHAQVIQARGGGIVWSSLKSSLTVTATHTKRGQWNFIADDLRHNEGAFEVRLPRTQFVDTTQTDVCTIGRDTNGFGQGNWGPHDEIYVEGESVCHAVNNITVLGNVGNVGTEELSDASLFGIGPWNDTPAPLLHVMEEQIGFLAINGVDGDLGNTVPEFVGFSNFFGNAFERCTDEEPVGSYNFFAETLGQECKYTRVDVVKLYQSQVTATPFFSKAGALYKFVSIIHKALRPTTWTDGIRPLVGHENDPSFITVAIVFGFITVIAYHAQIVGDIPAVSLMTANSKRAIWRIKDDVYMTTFNGITVKIGFAPEAPKMRELFLTAPDLLYASLEAERYFVKYSDKNGAITLNQGDIMFPPKNLMLDNLGRLIDIPKNVASGPKVVHVVEDANFIK